MLVLRWRWGVVVVVWSLDIEVNFEVQSFSKRQPPRTQKARNRRSEGKETRVSHVT